jgi:DNA gyrase subunit A
VPAAPRSNPETTIGELIKIVPAPDFPTAGIIYGIAESAGGLSHRPRARDHARAHPRRGDRKGERQAIIVDEMPYQVNGDQLLIKIGELMREKRIEGIADLRNESDKRACAR